MRSPWHTQLLATLNRNVSIKLRDWKNTVTRVVLPIYIITLLVIVKVGSPTFSLAGTAWRTKVDGVCQPVDQPPYVHGDCAYIQWRANENLLAYVPQTNKGVQSLMQQVVREFDDWYSPPALNLSLIGFDTEKDLVSYYNANSATIYAGVVFDGVDGVEELPSDLKFRIRINGTYVPPTSKLQDDKSSCHGDMCLSDSYMSSGFLALQSTITQAARGMALPDQCGPTKQMKSFFVRKQPLREFSQTFADTVFQLFTAMYLVWAFTPMLKTTLSHIVEEKETLVKDYMLLMGLRESIYWLSWIITYAMMAAITVFVVVFAAKITYLFEFSSAGALFLIIYAYSLSLITMAFALSTLFSKGRTAHSVSALLMLLFSLAVIPIELLHLSTPICAFLALFSPAGFAMATNVIVRAEGRGRGIHILDSRGQRNFWSRAAGLDFSDYPNPFSPGELVIIFLLDAILYAIIAWYLDNTWPHPQRGSKRPWNFCFTSKYWFPSDAYKDYKEVRHVSQQELDDASIEMGSVPDTVFEVDLSDNAEESNPDIEPVSADVQSRGGIVMKKVRLVVSSRKSWWQSVFGLGRSFEKKKNPKSDSEVIKGLDITLYEGQCFAVVGHSGSGKSAVVNLLSGLSRATSGEAYIYGLPVTDAGEELHSRIGVCPQQYVTVGDLTIREQLIYFAKIKGKCVHFGKDGLEERQHSGETVEQMAENLIADLGLSSDADKKANTLSLSTRRKLCLAIALVGDPQVVILDQPTRDLDLPSRKQFWDTMHKRQKGRVILFTTDSMEEADCFADRKAVLSHGVLKCCGSSFFLRNRFGLSYLLHMTKGERFNALAAWELVTKYVPTALLLPTPRGQSHVTYKLPLGIPAQTCALLVELMKCADELGLDEGALEATTLEEVFNQFQDEDEDAAGVVAVRDVQEWNNDPTSTDDALDEALLVGNERSADVDSLKRRQLSLWPQFLAILRARFTSPKRNKRAYFSLFLIPLILIWSVMIAQAVFTFNPTPEPISLQNARLGKTLPIFFTVNDASAAPEAVSMLDKFGPDHIRLFPRDPHQSVADLTDLPNNDDETHFVGINFEKLDFQNCTLQYTVGCHPLQIHEVPTVAAMVDNMFLQILRSNYSGNTSLHAPSSLHVSSHPLPYENQTTFYSIVVVFVTVMSLMLIPPIFIGQLLLDKQNGIISLFRMNGLRSAAFWLGIVISDLMLFYALGLIVLVMGFGFQQPPFVKEAAPAVFLLFLFALPATILQGHTLCHILVDPATAAPSLFLFYYLSAMIPYVLIIMSTDGDRTRFWHPLFTVIDPAYALTVGLNFIVETIYNVLDANGLAPSTMPSPAYFFQRKNHVIDSILGSAAGVILYTVCIWLLECRSSSRQTKSGADHGALLYQHLAAPRDLGDNSTAGDAEQEKERVQRSAARWEGIGHAQAAADATEGDAILCYGLGKSYGAFAGFRGYGASAGTSALQDLWLAVGSGEIVVLLGFNKAGKSSLLKCLAGIEPVSVGDALVCGASVRYGYLHKRRAIGYCPQSEVVYGSMTVREHLQLYAALKGLPQPQGLAVEIALQTMQLSDVADTLIVDCKPGTRRMLALAVALLGSPPVLMLDEPTSGMDFAKRKRAWKQIAANNSATLICTQSFDEASALGTRVGILVGGQLKCLAPPQELKRRYGSKYTLLVLAEDVKDMPEICKFINTLFPESNAAAEDEVLGLSRQKLFQVPVRTLSQLAGLLQELEAKREVLRIKDYVVSQPTLNQVFNRLRQ